MQIKAEVALSTFLAVMRHSKPLKKTAINVVTQLAAVVIARKAKIAMLTLVIKLLAVALVICEAMKSKFKMNGDLLSSNVIYPLEWLQMRQTVSCFIDYQIIPLHCERARHLKDRDCTSQPTYKILLAI